MGQAQTASGNASTAMGDSTEASGILLQQWEIHNSKWNSSTAMGATQQQVEFFYSNGKKHRSKWRLFYSNGRDTTASDYGSLVIGQYNSSGSSVTSSATAFSTANTAFVIGNGANAGSLSDAFKVMFNGDTYVSNSLYLGGTKITSTATELNLLTGATSLGTGILSPVTENSNTGVRLSTALAANHGDIGSNAVDLSYSHSASTTRGATGNISTAMGFKTTASGSRSTAMGEAQSKWKSSTAMGETQSNWKYFYSNGKRHRSKWNLFYSNGRMPHQQVEIILQQWEEAH